MRRLLPALAATLLLALSGCGDDPVRIGSKNFTENRILAELITLVVEDEGMSAEPHIAIGDTRAVFEALRSGQIDIYPEYSGTALALLGRPVPDDPVEAHARVSDEFAHLGLALGAPFGFESRFAVVMFEDAADREGLASVSDLALRAPELKLAVTNNFARRPVDGLSPFLNRYGLAFGDIVVLPERDRASVIDLLIDGDADVAVMLENDPRIADFGLRILEDDARFFPGYEAFPLVAHAALDSHPALATALERLDGQIDAAAISNLVAQVEQSGRSPRNVAREYLAGRGILPEMAPVVDLPPLLIAIDPADVGTIMANEVLRAARLTVPNRLIRLQPATAPVERVLDGTARVALVPAASLFVQTSAGAGANERLETIAAVGSHFVHALAPEDGPRSLGEARRIATGPPGSAAHRLATVVAGALDPQPEIIPLDDSSAASGAAAIAANTADLALVLAPLGRRDIGEALDGNPRLRLVPAHAWWDGATRLAQPYPRVAVIPAGTYRAAGQPVETLAMQSVVVGPAVPEAAIGHQGPVTYTGAPLPVTDAVVRSFNANLGDNPDVNPLLRPAAALRPQPDPAMQPLNRTPAFTVFSLFIIAFIGWAVWLLNQPLKKGIRHD